MASRDDGLHRGAVLDRAAGCPHYRNEATVTSRPRRSAAARWYEPQGAFRMGAGEAYMARQPAVERLHHQPRSRRDPRGRARLGARRQGRGARHRGGDLGLGAAAAGRQLAVSGDGEMAGSVSGGCVEGAVVTEALEALEDGQPRLLELRRVATPTPSPSASPAAARSACWSSRWRARPCRSTARDAGGGPRRRAARSSTRSAGRWDRRRSPGPQDPLAGGASALADRSGFEDDWFLGVHNPPLRMASSARCTSRRRSSRWRGSPATT